MYYRIFFRVLHCLENVLTFILCKIRVRTSQCPNKALAGGSYRFLNVFALCCIHPGQKSKRVREPRFL